MDLVLTIGISLMVVGAVILLLGLNSSRRNKVHASGGSVAVGGSNSGQIVNTNIHAPNAPHKSGVHWLTVVGIIVEVVGIGVTAWHAMHLAAL